MVARRSPLTLSSAFELNDSNEWNSFINVSQYASAYHLWEWGEALSQTYGYKRHYLAYAQGEETVAAFPLIHIKSMLFGNRLISLPFCEYGGIVLRTSLKPEEARSSVGVLLDASASLARNIGAAHIEIREPLILSDAFRAEGYEVSKEYVTFKIDLTKTTKQLWSELDKKTRNAVRKSMKSGLELEIAKEPIQLKTYYQLYLQTQKRLGSPPHCHELFSNLFRAFSPRYGMRVLLAKRQDKAVAGIIIFSREDEIFWWSNVSDTKYRSLNPTNFLLWNSIEWGAENGYRLMDMGRTRRGTTIYNFKAGWGGRETILQDYTCFLKSGRKQPPDPSQKRFRYLSRMWSLLPLGVSKRLGPRVISGIGL